MLSKQSAQKRPSSVSFQGPAGVARPAAPETHEGRETAQAGGQQQETAPATGKAALADLTVCDITGEWGAYQWSVCLFAILYSAVASLVVVFGPILTPDMEFRCTQNSSAHHQRWGAPAEVNASSPLGPPQECSGASLQGDGGECTSFLYRDQQLGLTLTNRVSRCRQIPASPH